MKGSGKSYSAKRLLLKLIERGVLTVVFDLNGEYSNLWKASETTPNKYGDLFKIFTPRLQRARMHELPFLIPLCEISYDDFATFVNVAQGTPTYQALMQFWRDRGQTQFDLNDMETYVNTQQTINDNVKLALQGRIQAARCTRTIWTKQHRKHNNRYAQNRRRNDHKPCRRWVNGKEA